MMKAAASMLKDGCTDEVIQSAACEVLGVVARMAKCKKQPESLDALQGFFGSMLSLCGVNRSNAEVKALFLSGYCGMEGCVDGTLESIPHGAVNREGHVPSDDCRLQEDSAHAINGTSSKKFSWHTLVSACVYFV